MKSRFAVIPGLGAAVLVAFALTNASTVQAHDDASRPEFYTAKVKPIFDANCARCHGGTNHRGGLNMDTRAGLLKGGHDGAVIVPGDPANSLLVKLIRHEGPADDPMPMPPNKPKISDEDIATVTEWIKAGAVMPQ
jgi:mono/diheme cytochrome c family protein